MIGYAVGASTAGAATHEVQEEARHGETAKPAMFHGTGRPLIKMGRPLPLTTGHERVGTLEQINEAFARQDNGRVTRAAIVPN